MTISIITIAILAAWVYDAHASEVNFLACTRIRRKTAGVKRANEATQMDAMYYANQVSK